MPTTLETEAIVVDVLDPADARMNAAEAAQNVAALRRMNADESLTVSSPAFREPMVLSPALARIVAAILGEVALGHTVAVVSTGEEVSTGVAAEMLGVSRPHVVKLIDSGILPGRKINRHRRVRLADVLAHKREKERQLKLLDELTELSQEMGLYDPAMRMPPR